MSAPYCRTIAASAGLPVGGKAEGLRRLLELGLPGAAAFVIVGARETLSDELFAEVLQHYEALGAGPVAVRSSALGEDSADASFAGQYDTLLNVSGAEALRAAIEACLASAHNERATAYREARGEDARGQAAELAMSVAGEHPDGAPPRPGEYVFLEVTDNGWQSMEYVISAVADGQSTVYLRWTMGTTDSSWLFSGCWRRKPTPSGPASRVLSAVM